MGSGGSGGGWGEPRGQAPGRCLYCTASCPAPYWPAAGRGCPGRGLPADWAGLRSTEVLGQTWGAWASALGSRRAAAPKAESRSCAGMQQARQASHGRVTRRVFPAEKTVGKRTCRGQGVVACRARQDFLRLCRVGAEGSVWGLHTPDEFQTASSPVAHTTVQGETDFRTACEL